MGPLLVDDIRSGDIFLLIPFTYILFFLMTRWLYFTNRDYTIARLIKNPKITGFIFLLIIIFPIVSFNYSGKRLVSSYRTIDEGYYYRIEDNGFFYEEVSSRVWGPVKRTIGFYIEQDSSIRFIKLFPIPGFSKYKKYFPKQYYYGEEKQGSYLRYKLIGDGRTLYVFEPRVRVLDKTQSIPYANVVRKMHEWYNTVGLKNSDFPLLRNDHFYTGIDFKKLNERIVHLSKTNLFCEEFLKEYKTIAENIDKQLKKINKIPYVMDQVPPYYSHHNLFCLDYKSQTLIWSTIKPKYNNYWKYMVIKIILVSENIARFEWRIGSCFQGGQLYRENGLWKIAHLGNSYKFF